MHRPLPRYPLVGRRLCRPPLSPDDRPPPFFPLLARGPHACRCRYRCRRPPFLPSRLRPDLYPGLYSGLYSGLCPDEGPTHGAIHGSHGAEERGDPATGRADGMRRTQHERLARSVSPVQRIGVPYERVSKRGFSDRFCLLLDPVDHPRRPRPAPQHDACSHRPARSHGSHAHPVRLSTERR